MVKALVIKRNKSRKHHPIQSLYVYPDGHIEAHKKHHYLLFRDLEKRMYQLLLEYRLRGKSEITLAVYIGRDSFQLILNPSDFRTVKVPPIPGNANTPVAYGELNRFTTRIDHGGYLNISITVDRDGMEHPNLSYELPEDAWEVLPDDK